MTGFIEEHRGRFGVEPICRVMECNPSTYWAARGRPPSDRSMRDESLKPGQYLSIRYTERLAEAGIAPSIGSAGDAYDNAMAEPTIGLFKTELIYRRGPWRTREQVEMATLEYIDWWNMRRLHTEIGDIPPAEKEAMYYAEAALNETHRAAS